MRLLELVMQGVPGSPGPSRLKPAPGLNLVTPGAAGPVPLRGLLACALYDEGVEPPPELRLAEAGLSRVGLTLAGAGDQVYRVMRDLVRGAAQLSRWDGAAFAPISTRPSEIAQYLRGQVRVPGEDVLRDLLCLHRDDLPSRRPREGAPAGRTQSSPGLRAPGSGGGIHGLGMAAAMARTPSQPGFQAGSRPDPFAHLSVEEKERRLDELGRLKATLESAEALQFQIDGLARRADALEAQLRQGASLEAEVRALEEQGGAFADLEALGEGFDARLVDYNGQLERHQKALARLEAERSAISERVAFAPEAPWRSPLFAGGLLGTAALTAGALGLEGARWLALLNPVALGAAAFALLQWIGARERHQAVDQRARGLDARIREAVRRFEVETGPVRKALDGLGADRPEVLLERLGARTALTARLEDARARRAALVESEAYRRLAGERAQVGEEMAALERRLAGGGLLGQDPRSLERDMEALRESLERVEPEPEPAAPVAAADPDPGAPPDPTPMLLARLGDLLHAGPDALFDGLAPRLGQYLAAFTGGAITGGILGAAGLGLQRGDGSPAEWGTLTVAERDRVYCALRLTLAEVALQGEPQPLVIERFFDAFSADEKAVVTTMLLGLASLATVVHHSGDPFWAASGGGTLHAL